MCGGRERKREEERGREWDFTPLNGSLKLSQTQSPSKHVLHIGSEMGHVFVQSNNFNNSDKTLVRQRDLFNTSHQVVFKDFTRLTAAQTRKSNRVSSSDIGVQVPVGGWTQTGSQKAGMAG